MKWKNLLWTGVSLLLLFVFWTILIQTIDVRMVGPKDARVGFASWNTWFHKQTGVNMTLYTAMKDRLPAARISLQSITSLKVSA